VSGRLVPIAQQHAHEHLVFGRRQPFLTELLDCHLVQDHRFGDQLREPVVAILDFVMLASRPLGKIAVYTNADAFVEELVQRLGALLVDGQADAPIVVSRSGVSSFGARITVAKA